jgi:hypothetical protein
LSRSDTRDVQCKLDRCMCFFFQTLTFTIIDEQIAARYNIGHDVDVYCGDGALTGFDTYLEKLASNSPYY